MRVFMCGAALLGACGAADAQLGSATWLWDVTTQNGDAVVEPGETATITLSIDMEPDVNFPNGPVLGINAALFDTLAGINADNGAITGWAVQNKLADQLGDQTTTDGQSLFGTIAFQTPLNGPFTPHDPIAVLVFEWQPAFYNNYVVEYATSTINSVDGTPMEVFVWEGDIGEFESFPWPISEANVSFPVVPSPATIATPCMLGCFALRRRRR